MRRLDRITIILLSIFCFIIYGFSVISVLVNRGGDFEYHIFWAQEFVQKGEPLPINPLYPLIVSLVSFLLPFEDSFIRAGYLVIIGFHVLAAIALYRFYIRPAVMSLHNFKDVFLFVFVVLALMLLSAITIFTWQSRNLHNGYIHPIVYHNSNIVLLRAIGLVLFVYILKLFDEKQDGFNLWQMLIFASLTSLSLLARPHHVISLLPVTIAFACWSFLKKNFVNWRLLITGFVIPSIVIILLQLWLQPYSRFDGEAGNYAIVPFTMASYTENGEPLLIKYFLSILFPLAVYAVYWHDARQSKSLNLAWLSFFVANLFSYFVVEADKISHFNFLPTSQIAIFILYVVSAQYFLERIRQANRFRLRSWDYLILIIFLLHLISGLLWYFTEASLSTVDRWW